jgi:hypothetical protein
VLCRGPVHDVLLLHSRGCERIWTWVHVSTNLFAAVCCCSEEELPEIETLVRSGAAPMKAQGGVESKQGKANVLIQVRTC